MGTHGKSNALSDCLSVPSRNTKYTLAVVVSHLVEKSLQLLSPGLFRPDPDALTGEANEELFERIMVLAKAQGLDVSFESRPYQDSAIKGTYSGKSIWVRPEESRAQQLKTLLHEAAHYYCEGVFRIPRRDAETIAESVAFTVGAHFGFDSGARSFSYVALWAEDRKVLEANLTAIRKVSTKIFDALESTKIGVTSKR